MHWACEPADSGIGGRVAAAAFALVLTVGLASADSVQSLEAREAQVRPLHQWVAFGDSVTAGLGASQDASSYVARLRQLIGPIDNRAISATTIARQRQTIAAYEGQANYVLWLVGYNDMRAGTSLDMVRAELGLAPN